jgi:hypothetical protein
MKALSLIQPWASLVISGAKRIETRSFPAPRAMWGQRFLVHASKGWTAQERALVQMQEPFCSALGHVSTKDIPRGVILGSVQLLECLPTDRVRDGLSVQEEAFGDFSAGRWAWMLANPLRLPALEPAKGALGFWEYPDIIMHDPTMPGIELLRRLDVQP